MNVYKVINHVSGETSYYESETLAYKHVESLLNSVEYGKYSVTDFDIETESKCDNCNTEVGQDEEFCSKWCQHEYYQD